MIKQLFWKELRLQQSGIYFAIAVLLVQLGLIALATQSESSIELGGVKLVQIITGLYSILAVPCMIFVVPLFIGAAMIAEERKLGMWEWQMSVPLDRFWQYVIKMLFGLGAIVALSFIVQPLLNHFFAMVLPSEYGQALNSPWLCVVYVMVGLPAMLCGAFASSLASDSYKAVWGGLAVMAFLGIAANCMELSLPFRYFDDLFAQPDRYHGYKIAYAHVAYWGLIAVLLVQIYEHFRFEEMRLENLVRHLLRAAIWMVGVLGVIAFDKWIHVVIFGMH